MRVLVYPHAMEIGGSQLNAVETGAALRDRGHEVTVISRPGPLVEMARQFGLGHIPLDPKSYRRPSPRAMAQLTRLVKEQGSTWCTATNGRRGWRRRSARGRASATPCCARSTVDGPFPRSCRTCCRCW